MCPGLPLSLLGRQLPFPDGSVFTMTTSKRVDAALSSGRVRGMPLDARPSKLRVLFVTEEDPLYVVRFFDVFLAEYPREELEISGITIGRAFHEPMRKTLRRMWRFYGVRDFFRQATRYIRARLRGHSIRALAISVWVPLISTISLNTMQLLASFQGVVQ